MYVYFDQAGDIKAITPEKDNSLVDYRMTEMPAIDAVDFLSGIKNVHRYAVVEDKATGDFVFVSKDTSQDQLSTLGLYLLEVTDEFYNKHDIMIEHDVRRKHLRITLSGTGISKEATIRNKTLIANYNKLSFYFACFGDPNMLICSFDIHVCDLIKCDVYVNLEHHGDELDNASLFTKKILSKYHYRKLQYT